MKKVLILFVFSCIFVLLISACVLTPMPVETNLPTETPAIQEQATPKPDDEIVDLPAEPVVTIENEQEEELTEEPTTEAVDMGNGFYLTYDSSLWHVDDIAGKYNPLELTEDSRCRMYFQWGHGMDPNRHKVEISYKEIGQTEFEISRWSIIATGDTIVYVFIPVGDLTRNVSVENSDAEPLSDYCIEQAEEVMRLSEAKGFLP